MMKLIFALLLMHPVPQGTNWDPNQGCLSQNYCCHAGLVVGSGGECYDPSIPRQDGDTGDPPGSSGVG
jgi:hypothetical protein